MQVTTIKKFRHKHNRGQVVSIGTKLDTDNEYGQYLVNNGLATNDAKSLKEYENKMRQEYEDKRLPVEEETEEQRTQGLTGPGKGSETPEQRTQGYAKGSKAGTPWVKEVEKGIKLNPTFAEAGNPAPDRDPDTVQPRTVVREHGLPDIKSIPGQPQPNTPPKKVG